MSSQPAVYVPIGQDGYELCYPVEQDDFERINSEVSGAPRGMNWQKVPMRLLHRDEERELATSDSPWLGGHALIFRATAIECLEPLLSDNGELLPLECAEAMLQVFNPTRLVDALDEAASSVVRFGNGRIMSIRKYVFRPTAISKVDIFKIPNLRVSPTFLSHRFVDCWKTSGLKGLDFEQVWALPG